SCGSPDRGQPDRSSLESRPEPDLRPLHRPLPGTGQGEMRERGSIPDCCGDNHHRPDGCQRRIGGSQPQWTSLRPLITSSNPSATSCESSRLRGCERRSMKNQDFEKLGYFYLARSMTSSSEKSPR